MYILREWPMFAVPCNRRWDTREVLHGNGKTRDVRYTHGRVAAITSWGIFIRRIFSQFPPFLPMY